MGGAHAHHAAIIIIRADLLPLALGRKEIGACVSTFIQKGDLVLHGAIMFRTPGTDETPGLLPFACDVLFRDKSFDETEALGGIGIEGQQFLGTVLAGVALAYRNPARDEAAVARRGAGARLLCFEEDAVDAALVQLERTGKAGVAGADN